MSKSFVRNPNIDKEKPDYLEDLTSRAIDVNICENRSTEDISGKVQTQEDIDEGWQQKNQSPLVDRMSRAIEELGHIQSSENMASDEVRECLKDCIECYQACTETTLRCLTVGGKRAESEHINLLLDCSRVCNTNADFMLRNSTYYPQTCGICADICDECADNCDRFEEDFMKECASVCRRCAESCREMAR